MAPRDNIIRTCEHDLHAPNDGYDVIVVGAGAAGLFAAGRAATEGARTLLLEKTNRPGRKLLITGRGRCNVTNTAPLPDFLKRFGANGRFLRDAFQEFFADDLRRFLQARGISTVTERGGRVFPASGAAQDIVDGLLRWLDALGVTIENQAPVDKLLLADGRIWGVQVAPVAVRGVVSASARALVSRSYYAPAIVLTTGGASYPGTGSSGDGYRLVEAIGHHVVPIRPALVPLETAGSAAAQLQGLSLKDVSVGVWIDDRKAAEELGEMLFTHYGVSGPVILTLSRQVVDALRQHRRVSLAIDLVPALSEQALDARLLLDMEEHGKQQFSTLLKDLLPRKLIPVCIAQTRIRADTLGHQVSREERRRLREWLKGFRLEVTRDRSFSEAIITAGGISTREIDPRTMQSRLVEGLYFAGEVIDIDADTGGFNLQAAFSTGWLAGQSAARSALAR